MHSCPPTGCLSLSLSLPPAAYYLEYEWVSNAVGAPVVDRMAIWAAHGAAPLSAAPAACTAAGPSSPSLSPPLTPGAVAGIAVACVAASLWAVATALYYCGGGSVRGKGSRVPLVEDQIGGGAAAGFQPLPSKRAAWRYRSAQAAAAAAADPSGSYEDI